MSLTEEVEVLRRLPLFQRIEPRRLKLLAFTSERMTFKAGDVVMWQGDPGDAAYIVMAGDADVYVSTPNGELKVATLGVNDIIGEIAILIDIPRTATVRAVGELTTLRISKDHFFRLMTEVPEMGIEVMKELARRLERTTADLREARAAVA
jgi:CRP/FNR family transcriptional regulator, cyclic AMP receptor protein